MPRTRSRATHDQAPDILQGVIDILPKDSFETRALRRLMEALLGQLLFEPGEPEE